MCLENVTEMEYLNEDTYFYKVVKRVGSNNKEKYESAMGSHLRMLQPRAVSEGIVFNYFLGKNGFFVF